MPSGSDTTAIESEIRMPLTQLVSSESLESFDIERVSNLFNNKYLKSKMNLSTNNSMVLFNTQNIDSMIENTKFVKNQPIRKPYSSMLAEHSMFTTVQLDNSTSIDLFVKLKKFDTMTDG